MIGERAKWEQLPNASQWVNRPESLHLHTLLEMGEVVEYGVTGWLIEHGKLAVKTWVVLATTHRMICLLKSGEGIKHQDLPFSVMKSAYTDARLGYHEVIVESDGGQKIIVSGLPKDAAITLASALTHHINRTAPPVKAEYVMPLPELPGPDSFDESHEPVMHDEMNATIAKVEKLEVELLQVQQRLAAVEDIIRRAAIRSASKPSN